MKKRSYHKKRKVFFISTCIVLLFFVCINYSRKTFRFPYQNKISMYNLVKKEEYIDISYYRKYYNNDDIIAKLEIPNLINILITQGKDNEYYLNHSIYKIEDNKGTEFMDFRVSEKSQQINIYGHNSRTYNTAFRQLEKYLDEDFYLNNQYIIVQFENANKTYKITAIKEVTDNFEHMIVEVEDKNIVNHIKSLKENSIYQTDIPINENSNILVLQTCSYNKKNAYYIIVAVEI